MEQPFGFLLIDKPEGPTSHTVVYNVRRSLKIRKVGHAGTLDPFASGLLIVCLGRATRLSEYLLHGEKVYRFGIILGAESDTFDKTGKIVEKDSPEIFREQVLEILPQFTGDILQRPPVYSALKRKGRKLYEYARAGEEIIPEPRNVTVHEISLEDFSPPRISFRARVGGGVYIRALGHDIGKALGTAAYVEWLRRTRVQKVHVDDAVPLDEFRENPMSGKARLSPKQLFSDWANISLSGRPLKLARNGNSFPSEDIADKPTPPEGKKFFLTDEKGKIVSVAITERDSRDRRMIRPVKVIHSE